MYDLSNICSLCLVRYQNLISIVSQDTDGTVVEEKLRIFLLELINFKPNIQKYICNKCLANLNYIYTFRLKWLENITTLNEYVQKLEVNEPNIKLSVTISDMKYGKVVSLELGNQYHSDTSKNELQNNCPQGNVAQNRVYITKEIAENVSTENTNFVQENSRTNLPVDVKIEIDKAQEISLQDNVVVKQSIDEHVEENFFEDNFSVKIEHEDVFNNFQTPYKIFEEFNEEKHIVEEDENIKHFEDNGSDDEYLPSNASSTASEASNSNLELMEIQSPASSILAGPKGTNSNVTKYTSEYLSTSNSRIRNTEENSQSSERGDIGQSIDVITHKQTNATHHKCDDCGKDLKPFKCDISGKAFTYSCNLVDHNRIHTGERSYKCDICGKAFRRSSHLIRHRLIHTGEKPYKCDICGKAFNQINTLVKHKRIHTCEKPNKCDICGKAFKQSRDLVSHIRIHTNEKPHKCDICGKAFRQSRSLVSHIRIHTNEKPHKCDICGKAFRQSRSLVSHIRIHNNEKPHKCDICGKSFNHSRSLVRHISIHINEKSHKCDICGKAFYRSTHLSRHKRIHTGEKPHKCEICGKAFTQSSTLVCHIRIHTNEKPHKCDICGKSFTQNRSLVRHKQTH